MDQLDNLKQGCFESAPQGRTRRHVATRATNMNERWLSVGEIAAYLGVMPDTIYKWIERRKMPAHKVGRLWKFMASEVDAWIRAGKSGKAR